VLEICEVDFISSNDSANGKREKHFNANAKDTANLLNILLKENINYKIDET
jgi:hypothetical protein